MHICVYSVAWKAGAGGAIILCDGSPARGVIWVEYNNPVVFQSPVGTSCGYFEGKNTHMTSLRDFGNIENHHLLPIFRP